MPNFRPCSSPDTSMVSATVIGTCFDLWYPIEPRMMNDYCFQVANMDRENDAARLSRAFRSQSDLSRISILLGFVMLLAGCSSQQPDSPNANDTAGAAPVHLTDRNFQLEVLDSEQPVLVDMWAPWCGPCIEMKPTIRLLAEELAGQVKVAELNIEENLFIKQKYGVDRYPTLLIFVDGQEIQRIIGKKSKRTLMELLQPHIHSSFNSSLESF